MSESTPLLPQSSRSPRDYSIFYRVCHSPWPFVPPKALLGARIALALFLLGTLILDLVYDIAFAHTGRQYVFHFSHVSLVLQLIYLSCTAVRMTLDVRSSDTDADNTSSGGPTHTLEIPRQVAPSAPAMTPHAADPVSGTLVSKYSLFVKRRRA